MTKLKGSAVAKVLAALLIVFLIGALCASVVGIAALEQFGAYSGGADSLKNAVLQNYCDERSYSAQRMLGYYGTDPEEVFPGSAFRFTVTDESGNLLYDNLKGQRTQCKTETVPFYADSSSYSFDSVEITVTELEPGTSATDASLPPAPTPRPEATVTPEPNTASGASDAEPVEDADIADSERQPMYTLTGYVLSDVPEGDDLALILSATMLGYNMRYGLIAIAAASLVLAVLLFVFLMSAAGHRAGTDEIKAGFLEKIPFDVFTAVVIFVEVCLAALCSEGSYNFDGWIFLLTLFCAAAAVFLLIGLVWCMSWAVRIKQHTALKGCLVYKLLAMIWHGIKKSWHFVAEIVRGLPLIKRAAVIIAGILLVEFIYTCAAAGNGGALLFGWFIERAVLVTLTVYVLLCMKKLLKAGKEISTGNMSYAVDTSKMYGPLKEHGEDLNSITAGLNKAVAERMKSERFKTELITNVSHDIKTPLTSIISYVDLMEKEEPENERMREYIDVLSRQSARLKKLIDDLMDASKASTGNLAVKLQPCELCVLIDQCAGEYEEKLTAADLELVVNKPEKTVMIMADGRHMWRVLDNLLNNICKYAQRGTRVYLSLEQHGDKALVTLKNISASMLNVSGDELMERFVRGDSSRSTEGSGLGLNIAKSLVELQNGDLNISVDGDLFKVTLSFDVYKGE